MFKKMMLLIALNLAMLAPVTGLTAGGQALRVNAITKVTAHQPAIRLASNDITQIQGGRLGVAKGSQSDQQNTVDLIPLSKTPSQVWLILTALFCFVMRSSRRVV
ncbi:MAG: hypothetical protein CTY10_09980 [Methylotenera sp.]|nr:MAG: hypothetical protein CTY10_09980 [Methylotenera sp.]